MHGFPRLVACTAEVRQMRRQSEDPGQQVAVLALGRQRAEVVVEQQLHARSQVRSASLGALVCNNHHWSVNSSCCRCVVD